MSELYAANNVFTMAQAIEFSNIDKIFLQMILKVIVNKLNLGKSVFVVENTGSNDEISDYKFYENPEMYKIDQPKNISSFYQRSRNVSQTQLPKESQWIPPSRIDLSRVNSHIRIADAPLEVTEVKILDLEKSLGKVANQVDKLAHQQDQLEKRVKLENADSFSVFDKQGGSQVLVAEKILSEKSFLKKDFSSAQRFMKRDLEILRDEVNENFCVLTKKVLKLSNTIEEYKDAASKIEQLKKILDRVAPKDYVESVVKKVDFLCNKVSKLQKDMGKVNSKTEDIVECTHYTDKRVNSIEEKIKVLGKIREILERLDCFDEWKKKIHYELEKFVEITEHLKIIKADREELDYIFEEKADRDQLLKLVTLDFFKSVQDDLSGGIVHVLEQLMRNEIEWEKAHKEIQLMMDVKADGCELTSLKRYMNCKLEIIQKKLNDLIRNKLTAHAAAVKIRLMKDARCITCTTEADINNVKHPIPLLHPTKTYDIKCVCEPKTRYCGGSHTLVGTDQKLITKRKLPLKSANATTLNFTMTEGIDGKLYRTRQPKCICAPVAPKEEKEEKVIKKELFPC